MFNEAAIKAYRKMQAEIQAEIEKLKDALAEYDRRTGDITWGNVSDMAVVLSQLKQINGEEE